MYLLYLRCKILVSFFKVLSIFEMKKLFFIFAVLLFWGCSIPNRPFYQDYLTPIPIKQSYISLQSMKSDGFSISKVGSAVIISDGYAITNRHIVEGSQRLVGIMAGWVKFPINDIILSQKFDLALLKIPTGIGSPITIGKKIKIGERIFSAGTTYSSTILDGIARDTDFMIHHTDINFLKPFGRDQEGRPITRGLIYEGEFQRGFSGGPIVNVRGELVGINQGYIVEFLGNKHETWKDKSKSYGVGYHIADITGEINYMKAKFNTGIKWRSLRYSD
jgi:S1-C subfamily serine protease